MTYRKSSIAIHSKLIIWHIGFWNDSTATVKRRSSNDGMRKFLWISHHPSTCSTLPVLRTLMFDLQDKQYRSLHLAQFCRNNQGGRDYYSARSLRVEELATLVNKGIKRAGEWIERFRELWWNSDETLKLEESALQWERWEARKSVLCCHHYWDKVWERSICVV